MKMAMAPCDAHVHVFDPGRFPYGWPRKFTPDTADAAQLAQYLDHAGIARVVLVQPSVYGADNRCMVDALARLGSRAKGIAVVSPDASQGELNALSTSGVVGARLNMVVNRSENTDEAISAIEKLDAMLPEAWHIQLHVSLSTLTSVSKAIERTGRAFVLDHFGLPDVRAGTTTALWQQLLSMIKGGRLCVKLSAPYLSSRLASPYSDLQPFVESLAQTNPDALLWGSNWPHTQGSHRSDADDPRQIEKFREENPLAWLDVCARWLGPVLNDRMHCNAGRLYKFEG